MKIASVQEIRQLEADYFQNPPQVTYSLMEIAMLKTAKVIMQLKNNNVALKNCDIVIFIGKGNNGGDGITCARFLAENYQQNVTIYSLNSPNYFKNEVLLQYQKLPSNVNFQIFENSLVLQKNILIIDAIFGIGLSSMPKGIYKDAITFINSHNLPVISLDLPSGINGDSGEGEIAIRADWTITLGLPKMGLYQNKGALASGVTIPIDIGLRTHNWQFQNHIETIDDNEIIKFFQRKSANSHKNTMGNLTIIGGSKNYTGAIVLNTLGAVSSGCGMIKLAISSRPFAAIPASVIVSSFENDLKNEGCFSCKSLAKLIEFSKSSSTIVIGSGMGATSDTSIILGAMLKLEKRFIVDADALNMISLNPLLWQKQAQTIITPHIREAERLAKAFKIDIGLPRLELALMLAQKMNCIVVLKGNKTIIANELGEATILGVGSYALSKGGSGDILAGFLGGLAANFKDVSLYEIAKIGAYLHSSSADLQGGSKTIFNINQLPFFIEQKISSLTIF